MIRTALLAVFVTLAPLAATAQAVCRGDTECRGDGVCNQDDAIPRFRLNRADAGLTLTWLRDRGRLLGQLRDQIGNTDGASGRQGNAARRTVALTAEGGPIFTGHDRDADQYLLLTLARNGAFILTSHNTDGRPGANSISGRCEGRP